MTNEELCDRLLGEDRVEYTREAADRIREFGQRETALAERCREWCDNHSGLDGAIDIIAGIVDDYDARQKAQR